MLNSSVSGEMFCLFLELHVGGFPTAVNSACWKLFHAFIVSLLTYQNYFFSHNSFKNTMRVSNSWVPDQERHSVSPDVGPNYLQRLQADNKSHR